VTGAKWEGIFLFRETLAYLLHTTLLWNNAMQAGRGAGLEARCHRSTTAI